MQDFNFVFFPIPRFFSSWLVHASINKSTHKFQCASRHLDCERKILVHERVYAVARAGEYDWNYKWPPAGTWRRFDVSSKSKATSFWRCVPTGSKSHQPGFHVISLFQHFVPARSIDCYLFYFDVSLEGKQLTFLHFKCETCRWIRTKWLLELNFFELCTIKVQVFVSICAVSSSTNEKPDFTIWVILSSE